jgi:hypothetical protein
MSVKVDVKVSPELRTRLAALADPEPVMKVSGRMMFNYFRDYHDAFIPRWRGPRYIAGGRGANRFGASVSQGWQSAQMQGKRTFVLTNINPYLSHKISGGRIIPKRVKMLTIPLIADARGRMAAEFQTSLGVKLFRRGKALAYRQGKGKSAKIINAYALSSGVNQAKWPGAMPPDAEIQTKFVDSVNSAFKAIQSGGRQL